MKSSSAVVLTYNNSAVISRCLKSLNWCDEVVIIDNFSTDDTVKIAKKLGAKVFVSKLNNNWSTQRNFGLKKTQNDWVFFVDSDEVVSTALKKEILMVLKNPTANGYYLRRTDRFLGSDLHYGETASVRLLRLANKKYGYWIRPVHEIWNIKGHTANLSSPLLHHRDIKLTDFITRLNHYTSLETFDFHWIDLLKPKAKFIVNYIFLLGFLDGFAGFVMAYMMSFNSLIVRIKSWEKQHL